MTSHILSLGAKFDKEISVRDTYFKRPRGEVLKISETSEGDSIVNLRAREGGFDYLQDEKITDAATRKKALEKEFGIKSVLVKKRRFYKLGNIILDFNIIDDVGTFLVVLGPNVSHDLIESRLGIKNPEYITVPFDELPKRKQLGVANEARIESDDKSKVFYRIDWLLDDLFLVPTEAEMGYRYKERGKDQGSYIQMAEFMRENARHLIPSFFSNSTKDFVYEDKNVVVLASSPRPYEEWVYDCAKSDIVITSPPSIKEAAIKRFEEEKTKALAEKQKATQYVSQFRSVFQGLYDYGLIEGILGRGSYFSVNGFPVENDNLNFMLLRKGAWNDEEVGRIVEALKNLPVAYIWIIDTKYDEKLIGKGNGEKVVYFALVDENAVANALGLRYEKYVLLNSPGIELNGLSKEQSESMAKELSSLLPDHNVVRERKLPRLPNFDKTK